MSDTRHRRFQAALCALQVALCTLLLLSAGLMTRTLSNLRGLKTGFDGGRVVIFSVDPHVAGYDSQQTWSLQQRLLDGARTLPGVENAALANRALMRGIGLGLAIVFPGQRGDGVINTSMNFVSPEYFDVMGIHVLAGRGFAPADMAEEGAVTRVVVNEAFVQRFLSGQTPLGRQFAGGKEFLKPQYEIIGVVNDTKYRSLREVPPPIFYSYRFGPKTYPDTFVLHVRTRGDSREIIQPVRKLLQATDPAVPLYQVATLSEEIDRSLWQERLLVALASSFSVFAMTLSGIGLYGILAYFVSGRRREIGLRMALGAEASRLVWWVVRRVIPAVAMGIAAGAVLSVAAMRWIGSVLYDVQIFDAWSVAASALALTVMGLAAAAMPALRAARVDPATALRQE